MKHLLSLVFLALAAHASPARAQSLADVLSSIQERKIAVEQRNQVLLDYQANYINDGIRGWAGSTIPDPITPIDWQVVIEKYPIESELAALSMEDRIKLLNIAIKEFDELKVEYVNVPETALAVGTVAPGLNENYTELDLPSLGRADHRNYHQLLQTLALQVSKVEVIEWPFNCSVVTLSENQSGESGTNPTTISLITGSGTSSTGPHFGFGSDLRNEKLVISGNDVEPDWRMTIRYEPLSSVALWLDAKNAPAPPGDVDLLGGEAVLFARDHYNPTTGVTRGGSNPVADGRYRWIDAAGFNPSQATETSISIPSGTVNISGSWEDAGEWGKTFVPSGRISGDLLDWENSNLFPPYIDTGYEPYFIEGIGDSAGEYIVYQRSYRCLVVLEFEKGLDEGANVLSSLKDLPPAGVADPVVALSPSTSLMLVIDLGPGVYNHRGSGVLGILHPKLRDVDQHHHEWWFPNSFDSEYPDCSFASELLFLGAKEDFQVSYETRRAASYRAPLPEWSETPGAPEKWDTEVHGWKSSGHFLEAWDRPRLRQVVGRQIVADIEYGTTPSDYERIVTLRRVPAGSDLTPGADGLVTSSGFPVIRTLTIKNPGHANGWPGPDKYSLEITDSLNGGDEKWTIQANDPAADPGLDDWTLETKNGTTLSARTTLQWDDAANKLTTKIWTGAGTSPATTAETIYPVNQDWFDPLSNHTSPSRPTRMPASGSTASRFQISPASTAIPSTRPEPMAHGSNGKPSPCSKARARVQAIHPPIPWPAPTPKPNNAERFGSRPPLKPSPSTTPATANPPPSGTTAGTPKTNSPAPGPRVIPPPHKPMTSNSNTMPRDAA